MEPTKVISLRIPYTKYEKMILECERKGITITEFIERKIAVADSIHEFKLEVSKKIEDAYVYIDQEKVFAKSKLKLLLRSINQFNS
jgi:hypothetical protein